MDDTRSIVIVGGEDGNLAKLITQIEPIRLSENIKWLQVLCPIHL